MFYYTFMYMIVCFQCVDIYIVIISTIPPCSVLIHDPSIVFLISLAFFFFSFFLLPALSIFDESGTQCCDVAAEWAEGDVQLQVR